MERYDSDTDSNSGSTAILREDGVELSAWASINDLSPEEKKALIRETLGTEFGITDGDKFKLEVQEIKNQALKKLDEIFRNNELKTLLPEPYSDVLLGVYKDTWVRHLLDMNEIVPNVINQPQAEHPDKWKSVRGDDGRIETLVWESLLSTEKLLALKFAYTEAMFIWTRDQQPIKDKNPQRRVFKILFAASDFCPHGMVYLPFETDNIC